MEELNISVIATVDGRKHDISDMCVGGLDSSIITALECVTKCLDDPEYIIAEYIEDEETPSADAKIVDIIRLISELDPDSRECLISDIKNKEFRQLQQQASE